MISYGRDDITSNPIAYTFGECEGDPEGHLQRHSNGTDSGKEASGSVLWTGPTPSTVDWLRDLVYCNDTVELSATCTPNLHS